MDFNQIKGLVERHSKIIEQIKDQQLRSYLTLEPEKKWIEFQLELSWILLDLLEEAQKVGISTAFYRNDKDDALVIKFYGVRGDKDLVFKFEVDNKVYDMIDQIENIKLYIESIQEKRKEEERIEELKKSAISKLTYEEQVALGLIK